MCSKNQIDELLSIELQPRFDKNKELDFFLFYDKKELITTQKGSLIGLVYYPNELWIMYLKAKPFDREVVSILKDINRQHKLVLFTCITNSILNHSTLYDKDNNIYKLQYKD